MILDMFSENNFHVAILFISGNNFQKTRAYFWKFIENNIEIIVSNCYYFSNIIWNNIIINQKFFK